MKTDTRKPINLFYLINFLLHFINSNCFEVLILEKGLFVIYFKK